MKKIACVGKKFLVIALPRFAKQNVQICLQNAKVAGVSMTQRLDDDDARNLDTSTTRSMKTRRDLKTFKNYENIKKI